MFGAIMQGSIAGLPSATQQMEAVMRPFAFAIALGVMTTTPTFASDTAGDAHPERDAIRWVVKREIKALQRGHAEAAYSFVAPSAHGMFPSQSVYLTKMLENFPALAYAVSVELGELRETSKGLAQMVTLIDRRGQSHIAFFFMIKTEEAGWQINNFIMVPLRTKMV
jgi:hypothetical protein